MLVSLHVKNLALIEETEVWFQEGLNILTGETGAGKSIIIGSIGLALGAKADKDLIRTGCDYALTELVFHVENAEQIAQLRQMELPMEEDGEVIITRRIMPNRSVSKVNGETVTAKQLRELSGLLIDMHGQHEHQSLLHKKKHFEVLDAYAAQELEPYRLKLKEAYQSYKELLLASQESEIDEISRQKELSFAQFELAEITQAKLTPGEDEALEAQYRKMEHAKRIAQSADRAYYYTAGDENGISAGENTGRALRELLSVAEYDEEVGNLAEQLGQIEALLNDFNRELADYVSSLTFEEETFHEVQERLNVINRLKEKYGNSIEAILQQEQALQQKCDRLNDYEAYQKKLKQEAAAAEEKLISLCKKVSLIRSKAAAVLAKQMKQALIDLNFIDVEFSIAVRPQEGGYRADGYDDVEFLISTNPGEPIKPLGNVASGGELSRIMLAIKTVLADKDEIDTLIFDEIDSGISGKTAWRVSEKMAVIGRAHQVICITHLPQIAAMADTHYVIEKISDKKATVTRIRTLHETEEIEELARLLGGDKPTESTYENARELKQQAYSCKNSLKNE